MRCFSRVLLAGGMLLAALPAVFAKNIYIATDGKDSTGAGTTAAPYFSLRKAITVAVAGDTIYITPGTYYYDAASLLDRSGTSSAPIKIRVRPDSTLSTQRQVILHGANNRNGNLIDIYGNWLNIDGAVSGAPTNKKYLKLTNSAYNGIGIFAYGTGAPNNITLRNLEISNSQYSAILTEQGTSSTYHSSNILIENCEIYSNVLHNSARASGTVWAAAISTIEANYVRVLKCNVYKNYGEGIMFCSTSNCEASNNYAGNNYSTNIYFDNSKDGKANANSVGGNDTGFYKNGYPANGITIANEVWQHYSYTPYYPSRGLTITNNTIYDCGYGIYFWRSSTAADNVLTSTTITGNTFSRNGSNIVIDAWGSGNTVQ
jgi:parallel beta-helix repeat protein